jgi:hypothetical protein
MTKQITIPAAIAFSLAAVLAACGSQAPVELTDGNRCMLNDLKYLYPPMSYQIIRFEYVEPGQPSPINLFGVEGNPFEDQVLLVGHWRDHFADGGREGHELKTAIIIQVIDPKTNVAGLFRKEVPQEFFKANPTETWVSCGTTADVPTYAKKYRLGICERFDYCNPPTAFLNNLEVQTTGSFDWTFIPLPMK